MQSFNLIMGFEIEPRKDSYPYKSEIRLNFQDSDTKIFFGEEIVIKFNISSQQQEMIQGKKAKFIDSFKNLIGRPLRENRENRFSGHSSRSSNDESKNNKDYLKGLADQSILDYA